MSEEGEGTLPRRASIRQRARHARWDGTYEVEEERAYLSTEQDEHARRLIAEADAESAEVRVNMRWGRAQVSLVRRAARLLGVGYQAYLKEAALRQALSDLDMAARASRRPRPDP